MAKLPSQITGHQFGYHQQAYVLEARQKVERTVRRKPLGNKRVSKLGVHVSWSLERPSLARIRYYSWTASEKRCKFWNLWRHTYTECSWLFLKLLSNHILVIEGGSGQKVFRPPIRQLVVLNFTFCAQKPANTLHPQIIRWPSCNI